MRARPLALAAAAALAACSSVPSGGKAVSAEERDRCRRAFAQCAPPARFPPTTNVAKLDVRKLVHLASRIDVGKLAPASAKRLLQLASTGDREALLELEAAIEDSDTVLGKCRCPAEPPELERQKVREAVAARLPSREERSPDTWVERVLEALAPIRELRRRSVEATIAGDEAGGVQLEARAREADRALCETIHGARDVLSEEAFGGMLESVYQRQSAEVGAGSAEVARRRLAEHASSSACAGGDAQG
jgi:hypothetical protein